MDLIPAIDIRSGRCVRLYQGDYQQETIYSEDPVATAHRWRELGAKRMHVVDLDGARRGTSVNRDIISAIAGELDIPIQVGGGIRSVQTASTYLDHGIERIIIGTAAIADQNLVRNLLSTYGTDKIIVALDSRDGQVSISGWRTSTSMTTYKLLDVMEDFGVQRFIYTDIRRDGTMTNPNFEAIEELVLHTQSSIIASGGVSSTEDVLRLRDTGVEGVIIGKALYTGAVDLQTTIKLTDQPLDMDR